MYENGNGTGTGDGAGTREPSPPSTCLAAALDYLGRGFSIIPLAPRSKQPAVKIVPYLSGEKRMSEAAARLHGSTHPDHGIAIVTGTPSGVVVIDCDPRNEGNNEETLRDCPSGLVAQTGGGGLHVFVQHPGGRVPCWRTSRLGTRPPTAPVPRLAETSIRWKTSRRRWPG